LLFIFCCYIYNNSTINYQLSTIHYPLNHDWNPAEDLIELGVTREDIILGLQPPFKRPYTDYGVA